MKRASIYARFSNEELQHQRSLTDQISSCRDYARKAGLSVVSIFEDSGISGASIINRDGMQRLLLAARERSFDVLIADSMSRIGRDSEDRAHIRKRMDFFGIVIMTPSDGVVTELTDGIRAVFDAHQLRDLAHMVRRGQRGRIMEGKAAGGKCYGYKTVKGEPGVREIVEDEAEIVRRIFAEFLAGKSPRDIAFGLNRDGIAAPRGRSWRGSTINGNGKRGNGILRNSIYAGILTWNRVHMVKDPDSAKRISQPNDPNEWVTREVPELAIVDRAIFDAAQRRKAEFARVHPGRQKRPRHILSGLLRCGACGGGMSASGTDKSGKTRIRCSTAKEGGTCPSPRTFYLDSIEKVVIDKLRSELTHPDAIAEFVRAYHEEYRRLSAAANVNRAKAERRMGEINREIARLVDAIAKGHGDPAVLGPRSSALDVERKAFSAELEAGELPKVIALHPAAMTRYRETLAKLQTAIGGAVKAGDNEASEALRELVESVTVTRPAGAETGVEVVIAGRLGALIDAPAYPHGLRSSSCPKVVAGESYRLSPHLNILRFELRARAA